MVCDVGVALGNRVLQSFPLLSIKCGLILPAFMKLRTCLGTITMRGESWFVKALAATGFVMSCAGASWLLFFAVEPPPKTLARFCLVCATLCCLVVVVWSWSATVAYIARRWKWEPSTCYWLSAFFYGSGLLLLFFGNSHTA